MTWWQIALLVWAVVTGIIWFWIIFSASRPGAQSQHGGELIGCALAFLWPLAPFVWLYSKLRGGEK